MDFTKWVFCSSPRSAALGHDANLDEVTEDLYQTHFDTNVKGPIFLTKAVVPHIARGGRIVLVSSAAARLGVAGQTVYAATKAAEESLARVWAKELGQSHDITVNCVNPGPVATGESENKQRKETINTVNPPSHSQLDMSRPSVADHADYRGGE